MQAIVAALLLLMALAFGVAWFLRAPASSLARLLRNISMFVGLIGLGFVAVLLLRFAPAVLPEMIGLLGALALAIIAFRRSRSSGPAGGGFGTPGAGPRTDAQTAWFDAWVDHGTGDVGGTVRTGLFAGRTFADLAEGELMMLHDECGGDADSRRVLEAYLDRRLGLEWRNRTRGAPPPRGRREDMTKAEALAILGLPEGASAEEVRAAHRRLIQRVHPDAGGSADLAARINRAKDVLLEG